MLYHLIATQEWKKIEHGHTYAPESLTKEGFIHLSTKEQVQKTYNRFFKEQEMFVLEIDEAKLDSPLKYESADGELFPHLYGALNLNAVVSAKKFKS